METIIGSDHPLTSLVKQCLHNIPDERPSAQELVRRLRRMEDKDATSLYASDEVVIDYNKSSGYIKLSSWLETWMCHTLSQYGGVKEF